MPRANKAALRPSLTGNDLGIQLASRRSKRANGVASLPASLSASRVEAAKNLLRAYCLTSELSDFFGNSFRTINKI